MYVALRVMFLTLVANTYGQVMDNEPENEITVTVFRLLVLDLLALFQALNQAMINILGMNLSISTRRAAAPGLPISRPLFRNVKA